MIAMSSPMMLALGVLHHLNEGCEEETNMAA
jgi:hypothetical protein